MISLASMIVQLEHEIAQGLSPRFALAKCLDILARFERQQQALVQELATLRAQGPAPGSLYPLLVAGGRALEQQPPAATPLEQVTVLVPGLRTVGENHRYAHLRAHMQEVQTQRNLILYHLLHAVGTLWAHTHLQQPIRITLARIAPRAMDRSDGLPSALKHCKDAIAGFLAEKPYEGHRHDDGPRFTWRYAQRRGAPKTYAVEITLEVMP